MFSRYLAQTVRIALNLIFAAWISGICISGMSMCSATDASFGVHEDLVPRYLLGLVHAPEVHRELGLSNEQVEALELLFRDIDAKWFPARNLPPAEQLTMIADLESQVRDWFAVNATTEQQDRLKQLEYYAQGGRALLRDDVAKRIGLQDSQRQKLADLARQSQAAQSKLARTQFGDSAIPELQADVQRAVKEERVALQKFVRPDQREKISKLLGEPFDPTGLNRIYAMAPEFASGEEWINGSPLLMQSLRGKVVLVHFYAFQCHNCHANFDIYRRWNEQYSPDEVLVVGIQTPETSRERDPGAVRAAAAEKGLKFPIQIDLKSESWKAWGNTMWPTVYVVDKKGYIRHWWSGELNWKGATADKTIEKVVASLLAEK